jgi:ribokinase
VIAKRPKPRLAVVGHVEWVTFGRVEEVPAAGEIAHAEDPFEEPAGGGAVAAVQLAKLAGGCTLVTALGKDEHGRKAVARLEELGVQVRAAWRGEPTRAGVTLVDGEGERTIVTFGARLEPTGADAGLEWAGLAEMDAVYFTAGDVGALRAARAAKVLVASPRAIDALGQGVALDALVLSEDDALERAEAEAEAEATGLEAKAGLVVRTEGAKGGFYETGTGQAGRWRAEPLPAEAVDSYGCGDSFAAGLTYGLGAGMAARAALELAARCGAACLTGRGPYGAQLSAADVADA